MHFVVSWDIKAEGPERKQIETELLEALKGYSWVRALTTFRIVSVTSQATYDAINDRLVQTSRAHGSKVNFLMSPLMSGGAYRGYLPKDLWPKIKERST